MGPLFYVLHGHEPVPVDQSNLPADAFTNVDARRVAHTQVSADWEVSTVFLVIDHNWGDMGPPLLFETMAFYHGDSIECWRYATWEDAEEGHRAVVRFVEASPAPGVLACRVEEEEGRDLSAMSDADMERWLEEEEAWLKTGDE